LASVCFSVVCSSVLFFFFFFCLQCLYLPFPYIISRKDKERPFFRLFFTLRMFLSHYFLKTKLCISDTFLRRITQHSFQRHLHARVTFFVFFSHTFRKVSTCFLHVFFYTYVLSYSISLGWAQGKQRIQGNLERGRRKGFGNGINLLERVKS